MLNMNTKQKRRLGNVRDGLDKAPCEKDTVNMSVERKFTDRELRQAAAQLGARGYEKRLEKEGKKAIRETALENLKLAREKRWTV